MTTLVSSRSIGCSRAIQIARWGSPISSTA